MTPGSAKAFLAMKTYNNIYKDIISLENLEEAELKARKRKTLRPDVMGFEKNLANNLLQLRADLLFHSYKPEPLTTFVLRDPKTRKISKSDFRDRVVHHALCNIIEPILSKGFIHDSYANQKGKGTLAAIKRFDFFKRKVSKNFTKVKNSKHIKGFVLKADVRQFFESVNHSILIGIIQKSIKDKKAIWLIKAILSNYKAKEKGKGMPLGNLTSQFFANVYLNELDQFVKHNLKAKCYIRYVDDFVILHHSKKQLELYKENIDGFLRDTLDIHLHPEKSKVFPLHNGASFLGLRIFARHKLLGKRNLRKFEKKFEGICRHYSLGLIGYDGIYDFLEGWLAWSRHASTYKLRRNIHKSVMAKFIEEISTKEISRYLKQIG